MAEDRVRTNTEHPQGPPGCCDEQMCDFHKGAGGRPPCNDSCIGHELLAEVERLRAAIAEAIRIADVEGLHPATDYLSEVI